MKDLKKVVNSFSEGLDNMDIVNAAQSTCSKAEASTKEMALLLTPLCGDGSFGRAWKIRKGLMTKGNERNTNFKAL